MHKLVCTKTQQGSQKAEYVCERCLQPFAFYNMTLEEAEEYVNKYYPEEKNILE